MSALMPMAETIKNRFAVRRAVWRAIVMQDRVRLPSRFHARLSAAFGTRLPV